MCITCGRTDSPEWRKVSSWYRRLPFQKDFICSIRVLLVQRPSATPADSVGQKICERLMTLAILSARLHRSLDYSASSGCCNLFFLFCFALLSFLETHSTSIRLLWTWSCILLTLCIFSRSHTSYTKSRTTLRHRVEKKCVRASNEHPTTFQSLGLVQVQQHVSQSPLRAVDNRLTLSVQ